MVEAYPLQWPLGYKRTQWRNNARFDTSFAVARDAIISEVRRLGGRDIVISTNVPLKRDGFPYANFSEPADPGVAVYFYYNKEQVVFACDKWNKTQDNMQAVRKAIEAFRGLERWGVSELLKQAFTGMKAIPDKIPGKEWFDILGVSPRASKDQIREAYRNLAKVNHPDAGGNSALFAQINEAYQQGLKQAS